MAVVETLCAPAVLYLVFSFVHIILDIIKGLHNQALVKFIIMIASTFLLNLLCERGLGVVSWIIVSIPFVLMSFVATSLLYVFGVDPSTGVIRYKINGVAVVPDNASVPTVAETPAAETPKAVTPVAESPVYHPVFTDRPATIEETIAGVGAIINNVDNNTSFSDLLGDFGNIIDNTQLATVSGVTRAMRSNPCPTNCTVRGDWSNCNVNNLTGIKTCPAYCNNLIAGECRLQQDCEACTDKQSYYYKYDDENYSEIYDEHKDCAMQSIEDNTPFSGCFEATNLDESQVNDPAEADGTGAGAGGGGAREVLE